MMAWYRKQFFCIFCIPLSTVCKGQFVHKCSRGTTGFKLSKTFFIVKALSENNLSVYSFLFCAMYSFFYSSQRKNKQNGNQMSSLMIGYFSFLFPNQMLERAQEAMKEPLGKRIAVLMCLHEIPQISQEIGGLLRLPFVPVGFWTHFEDDLNGCFSFSNICFMPQAGLSLIA